jgi:putative methionine-R-sulfoxide reductase with GAF domain
MTDFLEVSKNRREELYKNVHEIIEKMTEEENDILLADLATAVYEQTIAETLAEYFLVGMHVTRVFENNLKLQNFTNVLESLLGENTGKKAD